VAQTHRVLVLATAPAQALRQALLAVAGVRSVQVDVDAGDPHMLSVACQVDAQAGVEAALARTIASRWQLHRLERQEPSLESIFLHYVRPPVGEDRV
jgi:hypothetical protein